MEDFQKPSSIIYVFIDGIGIGTQEKEVNPFARFPSYFFSVLGGKTSFSPDGEFIPTDAHMGIPGLPQSATGQTALFTGYNTPKLMGRHISAFPTFTLRPYIKNHSILKKFLAQDKKATLINSYSDSYLEKLNHPKRERLMSALSIMQLGSGLPFFTMQDYLENKSLYMDITNWFLRQRGMSIEMVSPKETGRKIVRLAKDYDLLIYEYFFTDIVGHRASMGAAKRILAHIDGFLGGIWEELNIDKELFVLSSDHGNFEDLSHSHHTQNLVPTIIYGKGSESIKKNIRFLYDIPRELMRIKGVPHEIEYSHN